MIEMEIGQNMLFFFSALGVFNGLLLSMYILFSARPRHASSYFLALFFISLCIRIGKSVVFFFNQDLAFPYLQFGLMFCCFIGPSLYLYTRALTRPIEDKDPVWKYHLGLLVPLVLLAGYLYPYSEHPFVWRRTVVRSIYALWSVYSLLAIYRAKPIIRKLFTDGIKLSNRERWLISLLIGNIAIVCAYIFSGLTSYILGALLFSFMLYSVLMILFKGNKKDPILIRKKVALSDEHIEEAEKLLERIKASVEEGQLFLDADLKVGSLATHLNVPGHTISKVLNEHLGHNFAHFLNGYRIAHAKELLRSDSPYTMEALGYDSGFNSKSSFFATFKRFAGCTPSQFKELLEKEAAIQGPNS